MEGSCLLDLNLNYRYSFDLVTHDVSSIQNISVQKITVLKTDQECYVLCFTESPTNSNFRPIIFPLMINLFFSSKSSKYYK